MTDMENESIGTQETETAPDYSPLAEPVKKKKKRTGLKIFLLVLSCIVLGGAAGVGGAAWMHNYYVNRGIETGEGTRVAAMVQGKRETAILEAAVVDTEKLMTVPQVYRANVNSTVGIKTSITATNFWGYKTTSAASGSGFIITDNGYILTNYHVIEDSDSITVSAYDGSEYEAKIVGFDESNDVAVLKIEAEGLTPVVLGSSKALSVGDEVVAIGNPLGELTFSATDGIVSALDRSVTLSGNITMKLIQTDCAINSGNSGGALFNMYGEVVGITNAKFSSSSTGASIDNIGFAIPIDSVKPIVESIIEKGYVSSPYIGMTVRTVTDESKGYGLPAGIAIQEIVEDGPAAKAGLQIYDIITAVNGTPVTDKSELTDTVRDSKPGDVLELKIYRQGQELNVSVTVGEKIQTPESVAEERQKQQEQQNQQNQQGGSYGYGDPFGDIFGGFGGLFPFF